MITSWTG